MNLPFTTISGTSALNCGEIAIIKSDVEFCEMAITHVRSLLTDHHIKRLAS